MLLLISAAIIFVAVLLFQAWRASEAEIAGATRFVTPLVEPPQAPQVVNSANASSHDPNHGNVDPKLSISADITGVASQSSPLQSSHVATSVVAPSSATQFQAISDSSDVSVIGVADINHKTTTVQSSTASSPSTYNQQNGGSAFIPSSAVTQTQHGVSPVSIPAAFNDPSVLGNLTAADQSQIAQIASDFTTTIQNSGLSPSSPQYSHLWNTAAFQANEIFRQQFGDNAFNAMQLSSLSSN